MNIAQTSQRALHAVRLVLRDMPSPSQTPKRHFSVAVHPYFPQQPTLPARPSVNSWDPRHASSDVPTSDFLEPSSDEYSSAALSLTAREPTLTPEWATLYPLSSTPAIRPRPLTRRCDALARLVHDGDIRAARCMHYELSELHVGIQRRAIYLTAAVAVLRPSDKGKAAFLFWLELVPNRPAVRSHPGIKGVWKPVVDRLINEYSADKSFLSDFLFLAARKGILPTVLGPIMRHLAYITPVRELQEMMSRLEEVYLAGTTSRRSLSTRAAAHAAYAQLRVQEMRNSFLRAVAAAGWKYQAEHMLQDGQGWTDFTRAYVEERKAVGEAKAEPASDAAVSLAERVLRAKAGKTSPSNLANLIEALEINQRPRLLEILERRVTGGVDDSRRETWWHAKMLLGRRRGWSNQDIIKLFDQHFLWVGFPPTNLAFGIIDPATSKSYSDTKLTASPHILSTVFRALLPLLPSPLEFHKSYLSLSSTLSPRLRPTTVTHIVLLREITFLQGPSAGLLGLRNMVDAGILPSLGVYEAILFSMAGRGEWAGLQGILGGMEAGVEIAPGVKMAEPRKETYEAIKGILLKAERWEEVHEVVERAGARGFKLQGVGEGQAGERVIPGAAEPALRRKHPKRLVEPVVEVAAAEGERVVGAVKAGRGGKEGGERVRRTTWRSKTVAKADRMGVIGVKAGSLARAVELEVEVA
ncbi:uncharacterized protein MKK02DRAFT_28586 [Dioszegia hungarica]|uniref:Uncharacterized protein n=1 Tax=Dioszegia hungarica TaxID=4972 RepID=A0AA38LUG0_9TREE|nr:uncharacterized protein MKK02DRAFT_28586 [Dioszegia hungarica]KAI9633826.1 hypothetical protein MKK02DRAFT_28586 [Dioszegia hungarica]